MMLSPPGVYRAQDDTSLLIDIMDRGGFAEGHDVLDVGTGGGALAIAAVRAGATSVSAVDLSLRSVLTARVNCLLNGADVTVHRGNLFTPVRGRRFDLILTNPPYVPAATSVLPRYRLARCWDAGCDGRALLDRICDGAPAALTETGVLLLVQSQVSGEDATIERLGVAGLRASVVARASIPLGPIMRARADVLRARGLLRPGQADEELSVIEARRAR
jgi:release factor glutamine methyltransferase